MTDGKLPLSHPFDIDGLMPSLIKRAEEGDDDLMVQAICAIAMLLMGYRQGDRLPSAQPANHLRSVM